MMRQSFYFIMGVFFQEGKVLGISHDAYIGSRATIREGITHTFFSGIIDTFEDVGALHDHYGPSTLFVPEVSDQGFEFIKRYNGTFNHEIFYKFHKLENGSYIGHWQGRDKNTWGTARCIIRGINRDEFFDYSKSIELMKPFLVNGKFENLIPEPVAAILNENTPSDSSSTNEENSTDPKDDLPF